MDENMIDISKEQLEGLSAEELVDLKVDLEDLIDRINDLIEECDEAINS